MPYLVLQHLIHRNSIGDITFESIREPLSVTKGQHVLLLIDWKVRVEIDGLKLTIHNQNPSQAGQILLPNLIFDTDHFIYLSKVRSPKFDMYPADERRRYEMLRCHKGDRVDSLVWHPK